MPLPLPSPAPRAVARAGATAAAAAPLLWFAAEALRVARTKAFSLDEFQYAHAAWLVAQGQVPYRDFFEVHFPLVYLALAPLFGWRGDDPTAILWLRTAMVPLLLAAAAAAAVLNRSWGVAAAVAGAVALLATRSLVAFAVEIRPDSLAAALFLVVLALLRVHARPGWSGVAAGLAGVACAFSSQKAAFYGVAVAVALAAEAAAARDGDGAARRRLLGIGAGAVAGVCAVAAWLVATGAAPAMWEWCFVWAREHQQHYPAFSARRYLEPALARELPVFGLAAIGLAGTARALASEGRRSWRHPDLTLVVALLTTFGSVVLQRAPFPYSHVAFLALVAVFAGRGAAVLGSWWWARGHAGRASVVLAGVALLVWHAAALRLHTRYGNSAQLEVLATLARLSAPADPVYDNSGSAVARPHVRFLFYTDDYLRRSRARELATEVPVDLLRSGCTVHLVDARLRGLPPPLRAFLARHYLPYDGDLHLWGQRIGPGETRFLAPRRDRYFLSVPPAEQPARLWVDGRTVPPQGFTLDAGVHVVRLEGAAGEAYLLWLPRDGRHWSPRPQAQPRLSILFGHPT